MLLQIVMRVLRCSAVLLVMSYAHAGEDPLVHSEIDAWRRTGSEVPKTELLDNELLGLLAVPADSIFHHPDLGYGMPEITALDERAVKKNDQSWVLEGSVTQGFTGNLNQPANSLNRPVVFNDRANQYLLNQLYLSAQYRWFRNSIWQIRSQIDLNYGYDSQFISVSGLERHQDRGRKWNSEDGRYGIAIPQLYGEIAFGGEQELKLKLGHYYTNAGFESVVAGDNPFYSHSYTFAYGTPFTFTGISASFQFDSQFTAFTGYSQGWDSWSNDADSWNLQLGMRYQGDHERDFLQLMLLSGRDLMNTLLEGSGKADMRNSVHVVCKRHLSSSLSYVVDATYGYQRDAIAVVDIEAAMIGFDSATWFGLTQYFLYDFTANHSAGVRIDWFRDRDDSRIGTPVRFQPGGDVLLGGNYFGLTLGSQHQFFPNVRLRPEIRWDWSDARGNPDVPGGDGSVRAFGDRTDGSQITLAADITIQF